MADFLGADLRDSRFERADLSGSQFWASDLTGARFRGADPLVEAELDRRYPGRAKMSCAATGCPACARSSPD